MKATATLKNRDLSVKKKGFASFYTKGEEIFNAVSHIVGGALGLVAWIALCVLAYPSEANIAASSVFAASVIVLYTMSALYHFLPNGRAKGVFRIFDHCTIFLLIAGTYTPYCVIALGATQTGLLTLIAEWTFAAAGITMNAISINNKATKIISMILYLAMGWLIMFSFRRLYLLIPAASLWLLLAGGIVYTAGIIFFAFGKKVRYFHSIWHLFDLIGTALHFTSILVMLV